HTGTLFGGYENKPIILGVIWLVFVIEMLLRFFPSRVESMGCRKQFAKNYIPTGKTQPLLQSNRVTILIALGWLAFNGIFGALYLMKIMDKGMMVLLSLAFSVCDLICILFFCPFQTWFMKNKCCVSCRIYNWDYAMMFTPLLFIGGLFAWSLLAIAVALLLHWEYAVYKYPERFTENTNDCLSCKNCPEKLCRHKKQLQKFLKKNRALLRSRGTKLWK
ncbi:MAG: hypothetical protein GX633_09675, partial [Clostridiales bacterium]|nr:hypothetical protein [Clostridiales bacterium]